MSIITVGSSSSSAGTYVLVGHEYLYTEQAVVVEDTLGEFSFDGSKVGSLSLEFSSILNPTLAGVGTVTITLYDNGPATGPPAVPRTVATVVASSSGLQVVSQALTVSATPGANEISNTNRMYEVTITSSATTGDTAVVGSAGISAK